jgi:hypothetical protein
VINNITQILISFIVTLFFTVSCDLYYDPIPSNSIQISNPYNGSEIKIGESLKIKWDCRDVSENVRLDLYDERLYVKVIDAQAPNNFEYSWYPVNYLKHSENYQIKIVDHLDSNVFAFSEEFLIYKSIVFSDNNLNQVISNNLGNPEEITTKDLVNIIDIDAHDKNIWNIDGLTNCINLINLNLSDNHIYYIVDISELTKIEILDISNNPVMDINNINSLENIRELEVSNLNLIDLSFSSSLNNLTKLGASNNSIENITGISNLLDIKNLKLNQNKITDINAVENLSNLDYMNLSDNQIVDIEPLILNPGINSGDILILTGNPLNNVSINNYIPTLTGRGVMVTF